jgi:4a-hydroxytetrahydrobiopterin dehydratase
MTAAQCLPCSQATPRLAAEDCAARMAGLHGDWQLSPEASQISRRFGFKGFAKAQQLANMAAWFAERTGHHPDIAFGWGYCTLTYTTHEIGGLSEADFDTAARLDALLAS